MKSSFTRLPFEPEMILIPAGEFLMGSDPEKDLDAKGYELPRHTLRLADYCLSKALVTNAQYLAFVRATGYHLPREWKNGGFQKTKGNHPVVYVSLDDAVAYCRWLSEATGRCYRLPSEAEWEKGARGSDDRIYPWGDQWDGELCNTLENGQKHTTPVGAYSQGASPYGLLDMAGNVWAWTISLWGEDWRKPEFEYPYDATDGREDLQAGDNIRRVVRGGSFYYYRTYARSTYRFNHSPRDTWQYTGFRVLATCEGQPAGRQGREQDPVY